MKRCEVVQFAAFILASDLPEAQCDGDMGVAMKFSRAQDVSPLSPYFVPFSKQPSRALSAQM